MGFAPDYFAEVPRTAAITMAGNAVVPAVAAGIREAVEAVLRDLLRPTYVRDINFSIFGDTERNPQAREKCGATIADPFVGAGRTPEQWFASLATKH